MISIKLNRENPKKIPSNPPQNAKKSTNVSASPPNFAFAEIVSKVTRAIVVSLLKFKKNVEMKLVLLNFLKNTIKILY